MPTCVFSRSDARVLRVLVRLWLYGRTIAHEHQSKNTVGDALITPDPIIPSRSQECIRCAQSPSSTVGTRLRVWHRVRTPTEAVPMKILVVNPFRDTEYYVQDNLARIARPDTEFNVVDIGEIYPAPQQLVALFPLYVHRWDARNGHARREAGLRRRVHFLQP